MDDAIIRLRKWQLDREINKLEVELQMQQAWEVREAKNVETAAKTSIDTVDSEGEYKQRRSASKKSVKWNYFASLCICPVIAFSPRLFSSLLFLCSPSLVSSVLCGIVEIYRSIDSNQNKPRSTN